MNDDIRGRMPRPGAMEALERVFGGYEKTEKLIVMPAGNMLY